MAQKMYKIFIILTLMSCTCWTSEIQWDHNVDLDDNFRLLWHVHEPDIIFEVQVRTHGYVGFGFSRNGYIYGADMVIGWVDNKHTFFQDRHIKAHSHNGEPVIDQSQDYVLLSGGENATHTTLRFRRKLDTCDEKYDVKITNDTMKIVYMYHNDEPKRGSLQHGSLPEPEAALQPIKSLLLLQRPKFNQLEMKNDPTIEIFDVTNRDVAMKQLTTAKVCNYISLEQNKRGQIIGYEPIFNPQIAKNYIMHMTVYQCEKNIILEQQQQQQQQQQDACASLQINNCSIIVASWSRGSLGFVYPHNVGFPLDSDAASILHIQITYEAIKTNSLILDNSGIRFHFTPIKRKFDAGILSFGIRSDWTHVIPPGFRKVTSVGYCTGKANRDAFKSDGINVIGALLQTHQMGQSAKVRVVRNGTELQPFAQDMNLNSDYLEYRAFDENIKVRPGDDLIIECSYSSIDKTKVTLGGFDSQQEMCQAVLVYYPKQDRITTCLSKPKTKHFLKSFNIDALKKGFTIESPQKYAGRSLEEHLKTYDWKAEFDHFETVTKTSPFDTISSGINGRKIIEDEPVNIVKPFLPAPSFCDRFSKDYEMNDPLEDNRLDSVQQAKNKVLRSSEFNTLNYSSSSLKLNISSWLVVVTFVVLSYMF